MTAAESRKQNLTIRYYKAVWKYHVEKFRFLNF